MIIFISAEQQCLCSCARPYTQGRSCAVIASQSRDSIGQVGVHAVLCKLLFCFKVSFSVIFFLFSQSNDDNAPCLDIGQLAKHNVCLCLPLELALQNL